MDHYYLYKLLNHANIIIDKANNTGMSTMQTFMLHKDGSITIYCKLFC